MIKINTFLKKPSIVLKSGNVNKKAQYIPALKKFFDVQKARLFPHAIPK